MYGYYDMFSGAVIIKRSIITGIMIVFLLGQTVLSIPDSSAGGEVNEEVIDSKVKAFFRKHQGSWNDMNVPEADGELLYDLILSNRYKNALEIGTSTGYSSVWLAWALSKTGGKLITIENNEERYSKAIENFREAGLSDYIDARLADAHVLMKELDGPFDFVFSDADKDWYTNYFNDIYPKLMEGGCYAAHNVSGDENSHGWARGADEFYSHVRKMDDMDTTLNTSGAGMSISYKRTVR